MDGFEKITGPVSGEEVAKTVLRIVRRYIKQHGRLPGHIGINESGARVLMRYLIKSGKMKRGEILFNIDNVPFIVMPEYNRLFGTVNNDHQRSDFHMKEGT
jgi:hypothetical protein